MPAAGVVRSVNVGQARDVAWRGRVVRTAIWKEPVATRVRAGRLGLAGDQQADLVGHGGEQRALMVYQLASYRHWADHLGRADFVMGQFGENLTVDGLSDEEVCIGDRFRIGGAVVEVSQPRVSCHKLGLRMDHPSMPALVVAHRRPGFYLRVVEEGEIRAGDTIHLLSPGPERMSVAEIDVLLFKGDHPVPALERALRIPALCPGWQMSMQALLKAAERGTPGNAGLVAAPAASPAWPGFRALRVLAKAAESADVSSFVLADPNERPLPPGKPGQHLVLRIATEAGGSLLRNYSLCGGGPAGTYRIAVKREANGAVSRALHDEAQAGDVLDATAPRGTFWLDDAPGPVVLISAGVGATALLGMLRALVDPARAPAKRQVWWVHAARDRAHHVFADEVRALAASDAATTHIVYSRPGDGERRDCDRVGRIDRDVLHNLDLPQDATYYLCGPGAFMDAVATALTELGVEPAQLLREAFGSAAPQGAEAQPAHQPDGPVGNGPTVTLLRSGLTTQWSDRFGSLLELAEACGAPVPWACRTGVCHRCESGLVAGAVRYAPDPLDPPPESSVLVCCARPTGDVVLDL